MPIYSELNGSLSKLINRLVLNLIRHTEVGKIISTSSDFNSDWFDKTKVDYNLFKNKIIESFHINLIGGQERFNLPFLKEEGIIGRTINEILDITSKNMVEYDNDLLFLIAKCNSLMNVYLCSYVFETNINSLDDIIEQPFFNDYSSYYRGQTDYNYDLLPSFYRDLKIEKESEEINVEFVKQKYNEIGVLDKFEEIFSSKQHIALNYERTIFSYAQHTICYSPFLDVTESKEIATIFATSSQGINPNKYFNTDSSLFCFYVFNRDIPEAPSTNSFLRNMRVFYLPRKIKYYDIIRGKHLFEMSYKDFRIRYHFTNIQANDRAKIQKGHFFFIVDGFIINGHPLIPFNQISIVKIKIDKSIKQDLYTKIVTNNRKYNLESLMDPYLYFSDYSFKSK